MKHMSAVTNLAAGGVETSTGKYLRALYSSVTGRYARLLQEQAYLLNPIGQKWYEQAIFLGSLKG
jgi:hypothetical protein